MYITVIETLDPVLPSYQIHLDPFPLLQLASQCYALMDNKIKPLRRITLAKYPIWHLSLHSPYLFVY